MTREHPILFSAAMIRAILAGTKTQTRRVIKPQPSGMDDHRRYLSVLSDVYQKYGRPGDLLWVRETWGPCEGGFCYRADESDGAKPDDGRWHSARFMPRFASRITLETTDVRVERVRDISEGDAMCEGAEAGLDVTATDRFARLWDLINAKRGYGWDANPWVWVISFKRVAPGKGR